MEKENDNNHPYLVDGDDYGDYNNSSAACLAILFWAIVGFLILLVLWTLL